MTITVQPIDYPNRLIRGSWWAVFVGIGLIIVLTSQSNLSWLGHSLAIATSFMVFLTNMGNVRFYLTNVEVKNRSVFLEYYDYNTFYSKEVPIDILEIKIEGVFGISSMKKLLFYSNKKLLLRQYQVLGWRNAEKLLSVYNEYKAIKTL